MGKVCVDCGGPIRGHMPTAVRCLACYRALPARERGSPPPLTPHQRAVYLAALERLRWRDALDLIERIGDGLAGR